MKTCGHEPGNHHSGWMGQCVKCGGWMCTGEAVYVSIAPMCDDCLRPDWGRKVESILMHGVKQLLATIEHYLPPSPQKLHAVDHIKTAHTLLELARINRQHELEREAGLR